MNKVFLTQKTKKHDNINIGDIHKEIMQKSEEIIEAFYEKYVILYEKIDLNLMSFYCNDKFMKNIRSKVVDLICSRLKEIEQKYILYTDSKSIIWKIKKENIDLNNLRSINEQDLLNDMNRGIDTVKFIDVLSKNILNIFFVSKSLIGEQETFKLIDEAIFEDSKDRNFISFLKNRTNLIDILNFKNNKEQLYSIARGFKIAPPHSVIGFIDNDTKNDFLYRNTIEKAKNDKEFKRELLKDIAELLEEINISNIKYKTRYKEQVLLTIDFINEIKLDTTKRDLAILGLIVEYTKTISEQEENLSNRAFYNLFNKEPMIKAALKIYEKYYDVLNVKNDFTFYVKKHGLSINFLKFLEKLHLEKMTKDLDVPEYKIKDYYFKHYTIEKLSLFKFYPNLYEYVEAHEGVVSISNEDAINYDESIKLMINKKNGSLIVMLKVPYQMSIRDDILLEKLDNYNPLENGADFKPFLRELKLLNIISSETETEKSKREVRRKI